MLVEPAAMLQDPSDVPGRVIDLEWQWDWLGNTTRWEDDAHLFYERSIGAIANGVDRPASESLRPSALYVATNLPATGMLSPEQQERAGWTELTYGDGGNVTEMTVHGQCHDRAPSACTDLPSASPSDRAAHIRSHCECDHEQHYQYRWDELNRLAEARRWDRDAANAQPTWSLQVRQRYRYDGANVRMIKATIEPSLETDPGTPGAHDERIALYVYPGDFEVRGLERAVGSNQYIAGLGPRDRVETQYVVAGARLVWRNVTGSELDQSRHRRLTVPLTDIIQTTAATLDLLDGDLVEASTYYPNGARETLLIDETDPRATEPSGFTGKEGDEEVGLTYFGERYLLSHLGRWSSPDPLEVHSAGGGAPLNSYHYVSGALMHARDPLGLSIYVYNDQQGRVFRDAMRQGVAQWWGRQISALQNEIDFHQSELLTDLEPEMAAAHTARIRELESRRDAYESQRDREVDAITYEDGSRQVVVGDSGALSARGESWVFRRLHDLSENERSHVVILEADIEGGGTGRSDPYPGSSCATRAGTVMPCSSVVTIDPDIDDAERAYLMLHELGIHSWRRSVGVYPDHACPGPRCIGSGYGPADPRGEPMSDIESSLLDFQLGYTPHDPSGHVPPYPFTRYSAAA